MVSVEGGNMNRFILILLFALSGVIVFQFISNRNLRGKLVKVDKQHKEELLSVRDSLVEQNEILKINNIASSKKVDSLCKVKSKIQYRYVARKKEINDINDIDSLRLLLTRRYKTK